MRTKIISAFPGVGKTTYHKKYPDKCIDSDSSEFSWITSTDDKKERNPDFPANYIKHIKENIGKIQYIFVSSHKVVREALADSCLYFYLVYPQNHQKDKFIKRYKDRGSSAEFIKLLEDNWDSWMKETWWLPEGCNLKKLDVSWNLEDMLQYMETVERGEK